MYDGHTERQTHVHTGVYFFKSTIDVLVMYRFVCNVLRGLLISGVRGGSSVSGVYV